MKKVKVKTKQKQKQKQSQTVNINLGELLKKSKPRRKTQPKPQPNISQPITFNAPPIREYIDTSFSNQVSRLDNPLLARTTITNPIVEGTSPTKNVVGEIQNNNPLFQAQKKELKITDEPAVAQGYLMDDLTEVFQDLPMYDISRNINKPTHNKINQSPEELQKIKDEEQAKYEKKLQAKLKKENAIRKKEEARIKKEEEDKKTPEEKLRLQQEKKAIKNAEKKAKKDAEKERKRLEDLNRPKIDIGPSIPIPKLESSSSLIQSGLTSFLNKPQPIDPLKNAYLENASSPRQKNALISAPEEPTTILSPPNQQPPFIPIVKPIVLMTPQGTKHKLKVPTGPTPPKNSKKNN